MGAGSGGAGGTQWRDTDFRLVCATHRDLAKMVQAGEFREDLYYRLNVFEIEIPPLRNRRDDIAPLVLSILERLPTTRSFECSPETLKTLQAYDFPGNFRELRNLIERATLLADDDIIRPEHFPAKVRATASRTASPTTGSDSLELIPLANVERDYLRKAIATHPGDRRSLAAALDISERVLYRKIAELREDSED